MNRVSDAYAVSALKPRKPAGSKSDYGHALIIGGSKSYSGAPKLAAMGASALRCGAGLCTLAVPKEIYTAVASKNLCCTFEVLPSKDGIISFDEKVLGPLLIKADAVAFGMGVSRSKDIVRCAEFIIKNHKKVLIDADGLWAVAQKPDMLKNKAGDVILTPHAGEYERLAGDMPLQDFAKKYGIVMLLKGQVTAVSDGAETIYSDAGTPAMSKGGSGDLLSGIITGLYAEGNTAFKSAAAGAYISGRAGELAAKKYNEISALPSDTAVCVAEAISGLLKKA